MNWNILVAEGKESKRDSLSSGERNGNSLNQVFHLGSWENKKKHSNRLNEAAETCTIDGESPVVEKWNWVCVYPE